MFMYIVTMSRTSLRDSYIIPSFERPAFVAEKRETLQGRMSGQVGAHLLCTSQISYQSAENIELLSCDALQRGIKEYWRVCRSEKDLKPGEALSYANTVGRILQKLSTIEDVVSNPKKSRHDEA